MDGFLMRQPFLPPSTQLMKAPFLASLLLVLCTGMATLPAFAADENIMALSVANEPNESTSKTVQAKLIINAPPSLVWQTITNYPEIKHILPGYERSTVLKSNGASKLVDIGMKVSAFLPTYHYQAQMQEDQSSYFLTVKRVSGDFKALNANYKLIAQNNGSRTLLIYNLKLDTGLNLPGSQAIIRSSTERSMKALQRYIAQEVHKSLIGQR
jgi:ribosome-associated toxin RatA of RatAB toxin-antitoxin module